MIKSCLTLILSLVSLNISFSQNADPSSQIIKKSAAEVVNYKHSIGASLWMLANFTEDTPDYFLLTYGYQLTKKDRVFVEYNTWKYGEPMGTYGNSEELYPGYIRSHGIGVGYQRFFWKGLFSSAQATPFLKQYFDEQGAKFENGFQLYLQLALGYRFELFKRRCYVEPAYALKYWPIDTNVPDDFAAAEEGTPNTIFEPSLNFGFKF